MAPTIRCGRYDYFHLIALGQLRYTFYDLHILFLRPSVFHAVSVLYITQRMIAIITATLIHAIPTPVNTFRTEAVFSVGQ